MGHHRPPWLHRLAYGCSVFDIVLCLIAISKVNGSKTPSLKTLTIDWEWLEIIRFRDFFSDSLIHLPLYPSDSTASSFIHPGET
jgi:hypothetical protein